MQEKLAALTRAMIHYEAGCPQRTQHFLKVWAFARSIAQGEAIDADLQTLLEAAALTHDIGIAPSLKKYGSAAGPNQEMEGPPIAESMLNELGFPAQFIERVCYLIGHHHTYNDIVGLDYQILVEADFLVNIFEGEMTREQIVSIKEKIFKTSTGISFLDQMYL
jgi:HD superfamily phosphodiesterase